jgi:hypothetical protein
MRIHRSQVHPCVINSEAKPKEGWEEVFKRKLLMPEVLK